MYEWAFGIYLKLFGPRPKTSNKGAIGPRISPGCPRSGKPTCVHVAITGLPLRPLPGRICTGYGSNHIHLFMNAGGCEGSHAFKS